ncbi:MAG: glycosyltransferase, partial [Gammaproteobacteria bacterium]|nr:glycosyltransferase [Gammaproteobacteria bacterium]
TGSCPYSLTLRILEENAGIAGNWNLALSLAQGDFIKLLPADDTLAPNCIASQVEQFSQYGDKIALTFCARRIITRSGKQLLTARFYDDELIGSKQLVQRCIVAGTNAIGEPGAVLFPRKLTEKVGQFDGDRPYVIDVDYWVRLLQYGAAAAQHDALSTFRIDQNLSVRLGWKRCTQYL